MKQEIVEGITDLKKTDDVLISRFEMMIAINGPALLGYLDAKAFFTDIGAEIGKGYKLANYYRIWAATQVAIWLGIVPGVVAVSALYPLHSKKLTPEDVTRAWEYALTLAQAVNKEYPTAKQVREAIKHVTAMPNEQDENDGEGDQDPSDTVEAEEADNAEPIKSDAAPTSGPTLDASHIKSLLDAHVKDSKDIDDIRHFLESTDERQKFLVSIREAIAQQSVTREQILALLRSRQVSIVNAALGEPHPLDDFMIRGDKKGALEFIVTG